MTSWICNISWLSSLSNYSNCLSQVHILTFFVVWSFSKLTLQFLVASRVNVIWLTCYDFWKRGGQQLAKTSILTLFLGDQAQSTSHQECMVEVDKKMCPSGDHPFLASRLLLLQCQSKNAFEQKNKNPIILPERSTLFSNSHFCLKVNYYTSIFRKPNFPQLLLEQML